MKITPEQLYEEAAHAKYFEVMGVDPDEVAQAANPWDVAVDFPSVTYEYKQPVTETDEGKQQHIVGVFEAADNAHYFERTGNRPDGLSVIRVLAWTAANRIPYQDMRNGTYADAWGAKVVVPNTIGQGNGVPKLTASQRQGVRGGSFNNAGFTMGIAAEAAGAHDGTRQLAIVADSQGPSLVNGLIRALPEGAPLSDIILTTPVGMERHSQVGLYVDMGRYAGKGMKQYRALNPDWLDPLRVKDTNVAKSIAMQPDAHVRDYPKGMAKGLGAENLIDALRDRPDLRPAVHVISAEHDGVFTGKGHAEAVGKLSVAATELGFDFNHEVLKGHHHSVAEYVPYMAALIGQILRPDAYRAAPSR